MPGIKTFTALASVATLLAGCAVPLPGGDTGPFAPGNTLTFYYQSVLTDPPEQAAIVACDDGIVQRSCARRADGGMFPIERTETGVAYGNETLQVVMQQDAGGLPSGIGQFVNTQTGETRGMRWVSLPTR